MESKNFKTLIDPAVWRCSECGATHSIKEWDDSTLKLCTNRESRRSFKSLGNESCRHIGSRRRYICPSCNKFINGFLIKDIQEKK